MARIFVKDLKTGMSIGGEVFLLAESSLAETKAGAPYLRATLADRTGRIEARYWDIPEDVVGELRTGAGVRIDGLVEEYPLGSGQLQVRVERLHVVRISDPARFLPKAKKTAAEMLSELRQISEDIANPYLSQLLEGMFSDEEFTTAFSEAPAAKIYHHAVIGGLLEHSLAVVRLCSFLCGEHPELDRDLLLTAAILHDVGKTTAYSLGPRLDLTDEGKLIGHLMDGALLVGRAIERVEDFSQDLRNRLLHAILAHHGARERGSPVVPQTLEALALHHADWLDGSVRGFIDHVQREAVAGSDWTRYSRMFDTELYAGSIEPREEGGEQAELPF